MDRVSSRVASLSPVTAGRPVGEARFVLTILLPVRTLSLSRVFRDSDYTECVGVRVSQCRGVYGVRLRVVFSAVARAYIVKFFLTSH